MLQYPINVYPDEIAFDSTNANYYRGIKLTFKGDILSALYWRVYDYHTGNIIAENKIYGEQMRPLCYNNEEIEIPNIFQSLAVGRYELQVMLTQTTVSRSVQNPSRVNIYDRFVSRGKTKELYHSDPTHIVLEDNINVIYEWNKNGNIYSSSIIEDTQATPPFTHRAAEIVIKIGQDVKPILSYDASTGIATLPTALSQDYPAGTTYQLYANYLISNLYYFEVAKQIEFQYPSVEWDVYGGTFDGFVWQGNASYEKSYQLYNKNGTDISNGYVDDSYFDYDGNPAASGNHTISEYIDISSYNQITLSGVGTTSSSIKNVMYNANKEKVSTFYTDVVPKTVTVPQNVKYVRLTVANAKKDTLMLNAGSEAIDYEPYGYIWRNIPYETQGGTMIKYYTYEIVKIDENDNEWEVYKSDRIYSQNVHFDFIDDYDDVGLSGYHYKGEVNTYDELPSGAEINDVYFNLWNEKFYVKTATGWQELSDCGGNYASRRYKVNVHCALQNGMESNTSKDTIAPARTDLSQLSYRTFADEDNNWTDINLIGAFPHNCRFRVYRANADSASYVDAPYKTLIADIETPMFADYTAGTHDKYRYMVVPYRPTSNVVYNPIVTDIVENNYYGYTLTALHDTGESVYGKPLYLVGENWKIMTAIEDTDNVQNLNRTVHVGNGKYAAVTGTENNYISGSLTAELGRMICAQKTFKNDAAVMAEWRRFIAQDCPFILRNQKGDVWLVRVSDGGSIRYGEAGRQISSAVTFSWVECGSIYDYLIQNEDIDRG